MQNSQIIVLLCSKEAPRVHLLKFSDEDYISKWEMYIYIYHVVYINIYI